MPPTRSLPMPKSIFDKGSRQDLSRTLTASGPHGPSRETMNDAYNRVLGRQQTDADRRAQLDALDKGATMVDTATNVYDRLHPEEAPPDQRWRAEAMRDIDAQSDTIAGAS